MCLIVYSLLSHLLCSVYFIVMKYLYQLCALSVKLLVDAFLLLSQEFGVIPEAVVGQVSG